MSTIIMRMSKAAPRLPTLEIDGEIVKGAFLDFTTDAIPLPPSIEDEGETMRARFMPGLTTYTLTVGDREILRTTIKPERSETEREYIYTWQAHRYDVTRHGDTALRYVYGPYVSGEVA